MLKFLKSSKVRLVTLAFLVSALVMSLSGTTLTISNPLVSNQINLKIGYVRIAMASGNMDYPLTQVGIQAALNAIPATGGRINLISTSGTVNFAGTVSRAIPNVTFVGTGNVPLLQNNGVTPLISTGGQTGWVFRDLSTDAGGITYSADTVFDNVHLGATYYALASQGTANTSALTTATLNAPTGRGATYVIASVNATALEKAQADVVLTGTNDGVAIQNKIDSLDHTLGGTIFFTPGYYFISTNMTVQYPNISLIAEGNGNESTVWKWDSPDNTSPILTVKAIDAAFPVFSLNIRGITFDLNDKAYGVTLYGVGLSDLGFLEFRNVADGRKGISIYDDITYPGGGEQDSHGVILHDILGSNTPGGVHNTPDLIYAKGYGVTSRVTKLTARNIWASGGWNEAVSLNNAVGSGVRLETIDSTGGSAGAIYINGDTRTYDIGIDNVRVDSTQTIYVGTSHNIYGVNIDAQIPITIAGSTSYELHKKNGVLVADTLPMYAYSTNNADQTLTSGVETIINFNTNTYTTSLSPTDGHSFIIPSGSDGLYSIEANVQFAGNTTGFRELQIRKNNTSVWLEDSPPPGANAFNMNISAILRLVATDNITLRAYQDTGGDLKSLTSSTSPLFRITRIGN